MPLVRPLPSRATPAARPAVRLLAHPQAVAEDAPAAPLERLAQERDPVAREQLLAALAQRPEPAVLAAFQAHIAGEDVGLRNAVVQCVQAHAPLARQLAGPLLAHPDPDVRLFGVQVVGSAALPEGPRVLCQLLQTEPNLNVLGAAVDALAEMGDDTCIQHLEELGRKHADHAFLRFTVDEALAALGAEARRAGP